MIKSLNRLDGNRLCASAQNRPPALMVPDPSLENSQRRNFQGESPKQMGGEKQKDVSDKTPLSSK